MSDLTLSSVVDTLLQASNQAGMRTALGLGTIATQAANSVTISGGTITGTTISGLTVTTTTGTLTLANAKTLTVSNTLTFTGTDGSTLNIGAGGTLGTLAFQSGTFSGTSSGTNTGDQSSVTGNAGTATALATDRTIDGVSFNGTANIKLPEVIQIQCSDLATDIEAGTTKATFRMPFAGTLTAVRASVLTAPTGSTILIDINESGTTVLSTKLMIDAGENTSTTATTPYVISDTALADDAEITIDFDQVGSSTPGKGVVVTLYVTKT